MKWIIASCDLSAIARKGRSANEKGTCRRRSRRELFILAPRFISIRERAQRQSALRPEPSRRSCPSKKPTRLADGLGLEVSYEGAQSAPPRCAPCLANSKALGSPAPSVTRPCWRGRQLRQTYCQRGSISLPQLESKPATKKILVSHSEFYTLFPKPLSTTRLCRLGLRVRPPIS